MSVNTSAFVAEIAIVPFNFPMNGWAFCDGALMPISQNTALFSLLGTTYGGDGKSTFALPDLQGRVPMHPGQGQGLSLHDLGEMGGVEQVTLLESEMPVHSHPVNLRIPTGGKADTDNPVNAFPAVTEEPLYSTQAAGTMGTYPVKQAGDPAGGGLPHNNMQPYLTLNFVIALQGIFPPRP